MGYKMIIDSSIVDADIAPCYARYNERLGMFLTCHASDAQFVASQNGTQWWHIIGREASNADKYQTVELVETDDEEASALMAAFDAKREPIKIELPPEAPLVEDVMTDDAIDILRKHAVERMSQKREEMICNGFDIVLSDGKNHHFTLTKEDQLNLISMHTMRSSYPDGIPYQADGEPLRLYSDDDFDLIFYGASECRARHYVYSKNLCAYVNTLETLNDLQGISYGMPIPETHRTPDGKGGRKNAQR